MSLGLHVSALTPTVSGFGNEERHQRFLSLSMEAEKKGHERPGRKVKSAGLEEASSENSHPGTLILDFPAPELEENIFLLLKPPHLL